MWLRSGDPDVYEVRVDPAVFGRIVAEFLQWFAKAESEWRRRLNGTFYDEPDV